MRAAKFFAKGFLSPLRAARMISNRKGVKRYVALPLAVNVLFFAVIVFLFFFELVPAFDFAGYAPDWSGAFGVWLLKSFKWTVSLALLAAFIFFGFTIVGMVLASPFNDLLSEKVEQGIRGKDAVPELPFARWLKMTLHSLWESLKIALKQILFMALTVPFLLIPLLGFLPFFIVSAYFTGLGFYDISLARHFLVKDERRKVISGKAWEIFGLGVAMELLLLIPFAGLLVLPLGTTAATILFCENDH